MACVFVALVFGVPMLYLAHLEGLKMTSYDTAEVKLEEFKFGAYLADVTLEVEFASEAFWPGDHDHAPEGGTIEIEDIVITRAALVDECGDQSVPCDCQLGELKRAILASEDDMAWIESECSATVEW